MRPSLDAYLMAVAHVAAARTTCLRKGVGAVMADSKGRILAVGYNGVARGQLHCNEGHPCEGVDKPFGQPTGCTAVHAEVNAVLQCGNPDAIDTAYVTVAPCRNCAKVLLNTGCKRIVYGDEHSGTEDAKELWVSSGKLWEKAGDQP